MSHKGDSSCDNPKCRNAKDPSGHVGYAHFCNECLEKLRTENKCENCGVNQRNGTKYKTEGLFLDSEDDELCVMCRNGLMRMYARQCFWDEWHDRREKLRSRELSMFEELEDVLFPGVKKRAMERLEKDIVNEERRLDKEEQGEERRDLLLYEKRFPLEEYKRLRKEIEATPLYKKWRKDVFEKFGNRCMVCSSTKNLEIDHRYESFYSLVKKYHLKSVIDAYECPPLWDVNNGAPLCKEHHDQTGSSIYYNKKRDSTN